MAMDANPICRCGHEWERHFKMRGGYTGGYCQSAECPCRLFIHGGAPGPIVKDEQRTEPVTTVTVTAQRPFDDRDDSSIRFSLLELYDDPR